MNRWILTLFVTAITSLLNSNATTNTNRFLLPFYINDAVFDPSKPRAFILADNGAALKVVDLETRDVRSLDVNPFGVVLALSPNAERLYLASHNFSPNSGSITVVDTENLEILRRFNVEVDPYDIVATDSGLVVISSMATATSTLKPVVVFNAETGVQVGASGNVPIGMNLALHPSQLDVYGGDQLPGKYHHFVLTPSGVIAGHWSVASGEDTYDTDVYPFPDGARLLSRTGRILTTTSQQETDLITAGDIGFPRFNTVAFDTNNNLVLVSREDELRAYDSQSLEPRDTRRVPDLRAIQPYRDHTAVLVGAPLPGEISEIRFLLPKATSAAENILPTVLFAASDPRTIVSEGSYVPVIAQGRDADGNIQTLRMFNNGSQIESYNIAEASTTVRINPGTNSIYAVVKDNLGATAISPVIQIFGNFLPSVTVAPMATLYQSNQPVMIRATAIDPDGEIKRVRLFFGAQVISVDEFPPYELVFAPASAGTYALHVEAEDNLGGLNSAPVPTLTFDGASDNMSNGMTVRTSTNLTLVHSTFNATAQKGEPLHAGVAGGKSIWWAWKIPTHLTARGGMLTVDTFGSDFDTLLAVYSGGPNGTNDVSKLKLLGSNDDDITHPPTSRVKFFVSGNDVFYIAVDGREGVAGNVRLNLSFTVFANVPANDNVELAKNLVTAPDQVSNVGATKQPGEFVHAGNAGGRSVWWRIGAGASRNPIRISTSGSTFDTLLAVYTTNFTSRSGPLPPPAFTNMTLVAANDDASSRTHTSELTFIPPHTQSFVNYWIAVDGYNGAEGDVKLSVTYLTNATAGDFFGEPLLLSGPSVLTNGNNVEATIEPGEPLHAGRTNAASIWYTWVAPTNGIVSLSTRGSRFDTLLAVYVGTNLTSLTSVASNDDDPANPPASALIFNATAGTLYHIAVSGYGNARGGYVLALNQTATFQPRLITQWLQGKLWLNVAEAKGAIAVEVSTNLVNWTVVRTLNGGVYALELTPTTDEPLKFYRATQLE